jgi:hypothetical protein
MWIVEYKTGAQVDTRQKHRWTSGRSKVDTRRIDGHPAGAQVDTRQEERWIPCRSTDGQLDTRQEYR